MFGGYFKYHEVKEKLRSSQKANAGQLSYHTSATKIVNTRTYSPRTGITASQEMRLAVISPAHTYMPAKEDIQIFSEAPATEVLNALDKLSGVLAVDLETKGTQAADINCEIIGVGIADRSNIYYFDFLRTDRKINQLVLNFLVQYKDGLVGHNVFFDGAFLQRATGHWLNWKYDTYGMYRQLATEGYPGQRWGLKDAQVQLLNWPTKGDVLLDEWLVNNDYIIDTKKDTDSPEYVYHKGKDRWCRPRKSEMWRAPADIIGQYCGLDAASTWQLLYEVLLPNIKDQPYETVFKFYHEQVFMTNVQLTVAQQLSGITIDTEKLQNYHVKLTDEINNHLTTFLNHPDIRPIADEYNQQILTELKKQEPVKYKVKKYPKEPIKFKKDGSISKSYLNWQEKTKQIENAIPELTYHWKLWKEKYDQAAKTEHLNPNSSTQMQWLFYTKLKNEVLIRTDTGIPSTGAKALPGLGAPGKLLKTQKDKVKEEGYVRACLEHLINDRIHPQFRMPGTLTGRLAGSGGLNCQQLPKSRGYLETWRPLPGRVWIDNDHCLLPSHQVLTRDRGWVNILDITTNDLVWQVCPDTFEGTWVNPIRVIKKLYDGEVYTFGNRRGKISVTENHRMLFKQAESLPTLQTYAYQKIPTKRSKLPITSYSNTYSNYPEKEIWIALLLQADGYSISDNQYGIEVSKRRKVEKITELLGPPTASRKRPGRNRSYRWTAITFSTDLLDKKLFDLSKLGSNQVQVFLDALTFWDGSKDKSGAILWGSTNQSIVDTVQAYLVRAGYEARKFEYDSRRPNWKIYYSLRITKKDSFHLTKATDLSINKYTGMVGCLTVPSGYFLVRNFGQTFVTGNCSLEQVVLAELSKDKNLYKIYGPDAKPNDIYLFNGSQLPIIGDKIRAAGYDPDNPTAEMISKVKKLCKKERDISKVVTLGSSYGMGWAKLQLNLKLKGITISEKEAKAIVYNYWSIYNGVKLYEQYLLDEYKRNNGWVLNGIGRPIGIAQDYLKDIVNRVVQSTGHDLHMLYVMICHQLLIEANLKVDGIILDFHDQSVFECEEKDSEQVFNIVGKKAYEILNTKYLKGNIELKGDPQVIKSLADAKCE